MVSPMFLFPDLGSRCGPPRLRPFSGSSSEWAAEFSLRISMLLVPAEPRLRENQSAFWKGRR